MKAFRYQTTFVSDHNELWDRYNVPDMKHNFGCQTSGISRFLYAF